MSRPVLAVLAFALLLTGCTGRDFTRVPLGSLAPGTVTEAEIRQKLGQPFRDGLLIKNNETMKALNYAYQRTAWSAPGGVAPARAQEFFFWRDQLIGHHFTSSFPDDKTDFDAAKARQIKIGETTEAAVTALLGPPQGIHRYPLIADRDTRALVYLYEQVKGATSAPQFYRQVLVIQLDGGGVVRNVESSVTGER